MKRGAWAKGWEFLCIGSADASNPLSIAWRKVWQIYFQMSHFLKWYFDVVTRDNDYPKVLFKSKNDYISAIRNSIQRNGLKICDQRPRIVENHIILEFLKTKFFGTHSRLKNCHFLGKHICSCSQIDTGDEFLEEFCHV